MCKTIGEETVKKIWSYHKFSLLTKAIDFSHSVPLFKYLSNSLLVYNTRNKNNSKIYFSFCSHNTRERILRHRNCNKIKIFHSLAINVFRAINLTQNRSQIHIKQNGETDKKWDIIIGYWGARIQMSFPCISYARERETPFV